jgi:hypothetical protein
MEKLGQHGTDAFAWIKRSATAHVIRTTGAPTFPVVPAEGVAPPWEELAIGAAPLTGLDYDADRKTVHLFLLNNVSEDSDAHACIHPLVSCNNGRLDWQVLCERHENEATIQARVNQANKTWDMLAHKNERAIRGVQQEIDEGVAMRRQCQSSQA